MYFSFSALASSFTTRRRDGETQQLWSSKEFLHYRPDHVDGHARLDVDRKFLHALWRLPKVCPNVMEAIAQFTLASTDSSDVPEYIELVMMKSAFEALLEINHKAEGLVGALNAVVGPIAGTPDGPMLPKWKARWPTAGRPLAAWARDFCIARNAAAHGGGKGGKPVWSARVQLAFAALLFPLLVRKIMATNSLLPMDKRVRISGTEALDDQFVGVVVSVGQIRQERLTIRQSAKPQEFSRAKQCSKVFIGVAPRFPSSHFKQRRFLHP